MRNICIRIVLILFAHVITCFKKVNQRSDWIVILIPQLSYLDANSTRSSRVKSQTKYAIN